MKKRKLGFLVVGLLIATIFCGAYYQTRIYFQKSGSEMVVGKGGKISVKDGGLVNFEDGSQLQIGGEKLDISRIAVYEQLVDFTAIETGLSDQTFTCTGILPDDVIIINSAPVIPDVAIVSARASAANTVALRLLNVADSETGSETAILKIVAIKK